MAIANTISNLALAIAIGQGVTIAWWRKALNGATVSELHSSWSFSASAIDLLTAGKAFNFIALAALTAKLALVDNLLLQQAAGEEPAIGTITSALVRVPILDAIPDNYGGFYSTDGLVGTTSRQFALALMGYSTDGEFIKTDVVSGIENLCNGDCFAMVPEFGFNISCTPVDHGTKNYSVTPHMAINTTSAWRNKETVDENKTPYNLLSVSVFADIAGQDNSSARSSSIQMTVSWADLQPATGPAGNTEAESCNGRLFSQTCEFRPAKVMYPIQISQPTGENQMLSSTTGYKITTPWWPDESSPDGRKIPEDDANWGTPDSYGKLVNGQIKGVQVLETLEYDPAFDSNVQAFADMMNSIFAGSTQLQYLNGTGYVPAGDGNSGPMIGTWWTQLISSYLHHPKSCVMGIVNPSTYIMSQINSIALRVSVELGIQALADVGEDKQEMLHKEKISSVPFVKDVKAYTLYATTIYVSNWPFLWAAIASLLTCVCLVLPSYWGFWQLGRKVTLG